MFRGDIHNAFIHTPIRPPASEPKPARLGAARSKSGTAPLAVAAPKVRERRQAGPRRVRAPRAVRGSPASAALGVAGGGPGAGAALLWVPPLRVLRLPCRRAGFPPLGAGCQEGTAEPRHRASSCPRLRPALRAARRLRVRGCHERELRPDPRHPSPDPRRQNVIAKMAGDSPVSPSDDSFFGSLDRDGDPLPFGAGRPAMRPGMPPLADEPARGLAAAEEDPARRTEDDPGRRPAAPGSPRSANSRGTHHRDDLEQGRQENERRGAR